MVNRSVEVSGQFVEDCKKFQKDQQEWFREMQELKNKK
jgi:hypothetical protein